MVGGLYGRGEEGKRGRGEVHEQRAGKTEQEQRAGAGNSGGLPGGGD